MPSRTGQGPGGAFQRSPTLELLGSDYYREGSFEPPSAGPKVEERSPLVSRGPLLTISRPLANRGPGPPHKWGPLRNGCLDGPGV